MEKRELHVVFVMLFLVCALFIVGSVDGPTGAAAAEVGAANVPFAVLMFSIFGATVLIVSVQLRHRRVRSGELPRPPKPPKPPKPKPVKPPKTLPRPPKPPKPPKPKPVKPPKTESADVRHAQELQDRLKSVNERLRKGLK